MSAASSDSVHPTLFLLQAAAGGDQEALAKLFDGHRALMRLLLRRTMPRGLRARYDTEDILQSSFLQLARLGKLPIGDKEAFKLFLKTVVLNKLRDKIRREHSRGASNDVPLDGTGPQLELEKHDPLPPDLVARADLYARVTLELDGLDKEDQDLVTLRLLEGCSWSDVASQMELAETTARRKYAEAMERLMRRCLRLDS
jgi:RNA polymerase sigma factor (sigma-70 family)